MVQSATNSATTYPPKGQKDKRALSLANSSSPALAESRDSRLRTSSLHPPTFLPFCPLQEGLILTFIPRPPMADCHRLQGRHKGNLLLLQLSQLLLHGLLVDAPRLELGVVHQAPPLLLAEEVEDSLGEAIRQLRQAHSPTEVGFWPSGPSSPQW